MGRVEDAMRRAAEQAAGQADSTIEASPLVDLPLAEEPFAPEEAVPDPDLRPDPVIRLVTQPEARTVAPIQADEEEAPVVEIDRRHRGKLDGKLVEDREMAPASREQYRRLAATLHRTQIATGLKVVMIASAVAGEGKTLTAANLALTFSGSYRRSVLLIDGDLRRPSVHTMFGIDGTPGLSDGLQSSDNNAKLALRHRSAHLAILPAGRPTSDPMAGLTSERMQRLIDEAKATFDWVIIDTPPIGLMTDANLLANMADGTLLVVKAGTTPYEAVQRAADAIGRDHLLGVVLNRASREAAHGYGYGYKYYEQYQASTSSPTPPSPAGTVPAAE